MTGRPPTYARIACAGAIGLVAALIYYSWYRGMKYHPGDFGVVWFGAGALLRDVNPYPLIGPGLEYEWPWKPLYPATAMVAALPLALLPQLVATLTFVFVSSALLAYSVTAEGWFRLPMFASLAFVSAAGDAQWSPLFTAALGLPALAVVFAAKPTIGAALALAGPPGAMRNAIAGGIALTLISLAFFPGWPLEWFAMLGSAIHSSAPVMRPGGILVLLALLKWRRPEARLLIAMACVPQTPHWYEMLPLFLIPSSFRETAVLAIVSTAAGAVQHSWLTSLTEVEFFRQLGVTMIFAAYLPCLIMVLRRRNEGELPAWLAYGERIARAASPKRAKPAPANGR